MIQLLFYPIQEPFLHTLIRDDSGYLYLISFVSAASFSAIVLLRWYRKPMSAIYWLVATTPLAAGTLMGLYQIYYTIYVFGHNGWSNPKLPIDYVIEGIFTIHYGVLLTATLSVVNLFLHGWDLFRFRYKSPPIAQSS